MVIWMAKENEGMRCVKCTSIAKPAQLSFQGYAIEGWKCSCGEEYFDPAQAQRILSMQKLQREELTARLGRIRSNLILRIPRAIEEAMCLKKGEELRFKLKSPKDLQLIKIGARC